MKNPDVVIYSTAVNRQNPEVERACNTGVPFLHRSELLRESTGSLFPPSSDGDARENDDIIAAGPRPCRGRS